MKTDSRYALVQRSLTGVALAGVLLGLWGGATPGSLPSGRSEPVIDAVTPDSAAEGTEVTLLGANFGPSVGALQGTSGVSFNGVWSTPRSWSDNSITVAVPPGAATGEVLVTVSGRQSAGVEFTVTGEGGTGPAVPPLPRLTLESDLSSVSEPSGTATLTVSVPIFREHGDKGRRLQGVSRVADLAEGCALGDGDTDGGGRRDRGGGRDSGDQSHAWRSVDRHGDADDRGQ